MECVSCLNQHVELLPNGSYYCHRCKTRFLVSKSATPTQEINLTTIKYTVNDFLNKYELLWLHRNSELLWELTCLKLGKKISYESVTRCRRKLFEEGNRPKDRIILNEYLSKKTKSEKEYREFFGGKNG